MVEQPIPGDSCRREGRGMVGAFRESWETREGGYMSEHWEVGEGEGSVLEATGLFPEENV